MRLYKSLVLISTLIIVSLDLSAASAQTPPPAKLPKTPLVVGVNNGSSLYEGDIWTWNGIRLVKRTSNGHNELPIMSPTGDWVAFQQVVPAFVRQRLPGESDSQDVQEAPTDLYLFNVKSGQQTKIAGQPGKLIFATDGNGSYTLRSQPSWSPDGNLLTWTEIPVNPDLNPDQSIEQLVIYDVATQSSQIIVTPLRSHCFISDGFPSLSHVAFGPDGIIAILVCSGSDVDPQNAPAILFYDLTGRLVSENDQILARDNAYLNSDLIWLSGGFKSTLSCIACATQLDPATGTVSDLHGTQEMYSALAPDKLSLHYGTDSGDESNVTWVIQLNGKSISSFDSIRLAHTTDAAISPDGMQVVGASFAGQGTDAGLLIFNAAKNDTSTVTTNVTGMGWGPIAWRIYPALERF